jgi:hypothetical protein
MRATIVYSDSDGGNAVIIERDRESMFELSNAVAYELRRLWYLGHGNMITVEFERGELERGY